jgi:taurine dioxygenase
VTVATSLQLRPVTPVIGAEVERVDLSQPLAPEVVAGIRQALARHLVLFFPDQELTPDQQAAFGRQFGELTPAHPVISSLEGHPEVLPIDSREDRASWWHTDVTFLPTPPLGSILYMVEVPEVGGDTMWVSLQAAYDALTAPIRDLCDKLVAYHHDPWFAADVDAKGGFMWDETWHERLYPAVHPVVRVHPESRRKGLFVNSQFTTMIEGMSEIESDALLGMLYRHCQRPEFSCRFRWRSGSVAFWDNRATLHYAVDDYGDGLRLGHRVTIRGEPTYGPARPMPTGS